MAEQFSASGRGTHSEGLVVRFFVADGESWVGNFQPGLSGCDDVLEHPDQCGVIVVSSGQGYVVDIASRKLVYTFSGMIDAVIPVADLDVLIFQDIVGFQAIGAGGLLWSRRVSWDGLRSVSLQGSTLSGEAWTPLEDRWYSFTLDIRSGELSGGCCPEAEG